MLSTTGPLRTVFSLCNYWDPPGVSAQDPMGLHGPAPRRQQPLLVSLLESSSSCPVHVQLIPPAGRCQQLLISEGMMAQAMQQLIPGRQLNANGGCRLPRVGRSQRSPSTVCSHCVPDSQQTAGPER